MTRAEYVQRIAAALASEPSLATGCVLSERAQRIIALEDCDTHLRALGLLLTKTRTHVQRRSVVRQIDVWLDHRLHLLGR